MTPLHDPKRKNDMILRLKRIEGQLRGIQAMIEADAECEQVAQQLAASRKALDKAFFQLVACAIEQIGESRVQPGRMKEQGEQVAELLAKYA